MDIFQAIILSIVEGITEFLPISSTGHLILTSTLLGITQTEFVKSFEIIIQLGAILAVMVLYWRRFLQSKMVWRNVLAGFIPTAIVGLVLYKFIKASLIGNPLVTVVALFVGGVVLIILEKIYKEQSTHKTSIEQMTIKQSALIGLVQALSVVPGVSRSAASIMGGLFVGLKRQTAVEFSFLLAIPTLLAATGKDLLETQLAFTGQEWLVIAVGLVGSFLVALVVVKWFIKFVQTNSFVGFGIYRIIVAVLFWIFVLR